MPLRVCPCPAPLLSSLTDPPLFFTYASHAFQSPVLYDPSAGVPAFLPAESNVSCKAYPSHSRKLPDSPFGRRTPHSKQDHCTGGPTFPPEQALGWENLSAGGGNGCPLSESRGTAVRGPRFSSSQLGTVWPGLCPSLSMKWVGPTLFSPD